MKSYIFYVENKSNQPKNNVLIIGDESLRKEDADVIIKHINPSPYLLLKDELNFDNNGWIEIGFMEIVEFNFSRYDDIKIFTSNKESEEELIFTLNTFAVNHVKQNKTIFKIDNKNSLLLNMSANSSFAIHLHIQLYFRNTGNNTGKIITEAISRLNK